MTNDNKPPMFGPSAVIDPATYDPRSGKSVLMNELMAELRGSRKPWLQRSSATARRRCQ